MWLCKAPVDEDRPFSEHLDCLWSMLEPHADYLKSLKETMRVDIYCSYFSTSQIAGFEINQNSLEIFQALDIPLGVSVIISC